MANTYNYGIISGGTGSFGSLQYTTNGAGGTKEFMKTGSAGSGPVLYNLTSVSASTTVQGGAATFDSVQLNSNIIKASDGGNTITLDTDDNVTIAGDLTVSGNDIDFAAGTANIGASVGANNLSLGGASSTVVIPGNLTVQGTTTTVDTTNLLVKDKLVTLNDGGAADSAGGAGLEFEEDSAITGFIKMAADRAGYEFKDSANGNTITIDMGADAKTVTVSGDLDIEANSAINQDVTTDANVTFANISGAQLSGSGNLIVDGTSTLNGNVTVKNGASLTSNNVDINGGAIDGTNIGAASRGTGAFTTLDANGDVTLGSDFSDTITFNGDVSNDGIAPSNTGQADLGGAAQVWRRLYVTDIEGSSSDAYVSFSSRAGFEQQAFFSGSVVLGDAYGDAITANGEVTLSNSNLRISGSGTGVSGFQDSNETNYYSLIKVNQLVDTVDAYVSGFSYNIDQNRFAFVYTTGSGESQFGMIDVEAGNLYLSGTSLEVTDFAAGITVDKDTNLATFTGGTNDSGAALTSSYEGGLVRVKSGQKNDVELIMGWYDSAREDSSDLTGFNGNIFFKSQDDDGDGVMLNFITASMVSQSNGLHTGRFAFGAYSGSIQNVIDPVNAQDAATKAYVDSQLGSSDLDFIGDSGGAQSVDLDSQTFTIAGTANEIETAGSAQTITIGLPSNVTITSNLTAGGTFGVSGSATLGNATDDVTTVTGQLTASFGAQVNGGNLVMANTFDILPGTNLGSDLGSTTNRFGSVYADNVYTGDFHMKNERGDWTLFEESDHIRIRNNATGQEFKLNMTPIEE